MKKWERFTNTIDIETEKRILHDIKLERQAIKEIESIFKYDIGMDKLEPQEEIVSFGALYRSCICIEGILLLTQNGFYGSANALFRQVYEQLVWAKIAIDNDDINLLIKIHDDYYNENIKSGRDRLNEYYTKLKFEIYDDSLDEKKIIDEGKKVFSLYSNYVHGGSQAQQIPIASDVFYTNMRVVVQEIGLWIECLIEVIQQYLSKCLVFTNSNNTNSIEDFLISYEGKQHMVANYLNEQLYAQKSRIRSIVPDIDKQVIFQILANTRWRL
ncbi:hypothetical protein [Butyrivibrio fibrisolvens]|uniref:hypothetical protein n=1 Tax=Butyrivibrio fibrisolvens TaxID=831 RepID=UPI0012BBCBD6|nr:hypothetical protein [Butyrivibrio fibrisolvens]